MEETQEVLNSSGSSNLRELIMQKLSAAREQKLKQNKSTSNISNTSIIAPMPVAMTTLTPWEEEKQLLLSMLEKSQNSASQSNLERKQLDLKISQLTEQNRVLTTENKNFKAELERIYSKNPTAKNESYLIEEFKKLESLSDEREKKYKDEIITLRDQLSQKYESKESLIKNELVMLEEKYSLLSESSKEKDKELEKLKKIIKSSKTPNNEKTLSSALSEVKSEKEKLERNLDRTIKMSCEKESQLSDEILKLKTQISQLSEAKDLKEKDLTGQITGLNQEIALLKKRLHENAKKSNDERCGFEKEKAEMKTILENLQKEVKLSEAFSTFATMKSDLLRAEETILQHEATIEHLQHEAMHNLDMIPTKEKANKDLKTCILSLQKDFIDFATKIKSAEDLHISELVQKNAEISVLQGEIAELRHKIVVFESKKYENELMLIRSDLHKAVAERVHAKRLIISYIRSVKQLEKMINDRIDNESLPEMYKLEIGRLNDENMSIVEEKGKLEDFYDNEIKGLQSVIDDQNQRIQELESKIDGVNKLKNKENTDEMKSWIVKNKQLQEFNKRLIESLTNFEGKGGQNGGTNGKKNFQRMDGVKGVNKVV
ncbi:hypothetical protein SteCoe_30070 [Stentor coeruleus]|uniref:Uncharacterized protein n=1 Tax=Stentor coeruleus TaxID=5963 RepID=A0A1R2B4D1_9CILI|nr:hypothetical protein SteCoe_30070 [Stentor coeruleus]